MKVLYIALLVLNFVCVVAEDGPGGASAPVSAEAPTGMQAADTTNNNVATIAPSTPVTQPNLEVRSPDAVPVGSAVVNSSAPIVTPDVASDNSVPATQTLVAAQDSTATAVPSIATGDATAVTQSASPEVNAATVDAMVTVAATESTPTEVTQLAVVTPDTASTPPSTTTSDKPAQPAAAKVEEKPNAKKERQEVMSNINTLDVEEEGNWLLKRVWWEQAEQTFEKIISCNDDVIKLQIDYISKRSELDKKLNELFRKLGFDQGEIAEVLEYFLHHISTQREAEGLAISEREFLDLLNHKKEDIEKLKIDLGSLGDLDISVDDVISKLVEQVNKSRDYEKSAWQDFKEIGRVLNDKKAKTLFYQIEADLKSIQNIQTYLTVELKKYYQDLLDKIDKTSAEIVSKINDLQREIGNIKEQFEKLQHAEELKKQGKLEGKLKQDLANKQTKPKQQKSWLGSIWDKVTNIF